MYVPPMTLTHFRINVAHQGEEQALFKNENDDRTSHRV